MRKTRMLVISVAAALGLLVVPGCGERGLLTGVRDGHLGVARWSRNHPPRAKRLQEQRRIRQRGPVRSGACHARLRTPHR